MDFWKTACLEHAATPKCFEEHVAPRSNRCQNPEIAPSSPISYSIVCQLHEFVMVVVQRRNYLRDKERGPSHSFARPRASPYTCRLRTVTYDHTSRPRTNKSKSANTGFREAAGTWDNDVHPRRKARGSRRCMMTREGPAGVARRRRAHRPPANQQHGGPQQINGHERTKPLVSNDRKDARK
jgi:hypothetical protein